MAEVNQLTDITIELIEHKNGRRVEKLQFKVELVKQTPLLFPVPPIIDDQLLQRVIDLGFSKADASDLVAQYSDEQLRLAIERVEARSRAVGMSPLTAPAGYFRWVLQDLAKNPPSAAQTPQAPPTRSRSLSPATSRKIPWRSCISVSSTSRSWRSWRARAAASRRTSCCRRASRSSRAKPSPVRWSWAVRH